MGNRFNELEKYIVDLGKNIFNESIIVISDNLKDIKISNDKILHSKIYNYLKENFEYPILSEEDDVIYDFLEIDDYLWIVDPLDGSLNFSRRIPLFCISISLWRNGSPIYGLIYDIVRGEKYSGLCKERNAIMNDKIISVSLIENINKGVLCTGFPSWRKYGKESLYEFISKVQKWKKLRLLGSAALSLAWVACGRVDAYIEEDIRIWDVAAGLAIVKAAGGDIYIEKRERNNFITAIATNGNISIKEFE